MSELSNYKEMYENLKSEHDEVLKENSSLKAAHKRLLEKY